MRNASPMATAGETLSAHSDISDAALTLSKAEWSARRWHFVRRAGPQIFHLHPAGKGKPRKRVVVASHRLVPIDGSKYPAEALRAIRARRENWHGEIHR